MKMREALEIINKKAGYMVSFEIKDGCILRSDHFPDFHAGEPLIQDEEKAWRLAESFANAAKGWAINIYVIDDSFRPVKGYAEKCIENF